MSDRIILHVDCNCFYASVEMLYHPELVGKPLAVGGDPEERHGIVLTANYIAKRRGVKTGMALWQARQCCPDLDRSHGELCAPWRSHADHRKRLSDCAGDQCKDPPGAWHHGQHRRLLEQDLRKTRERL